MMFLKRFTYKSAARIMIPAGLIVTLASSHSWANDLITVYMNHARILKFDQPVSKVVIGNSEVADVTVSDPQTVVLTAKSFGTTNLVILDGVGEPVIDKRVVVTVDEENSVRVFRQENRTVMSCSPICESQSNK